MKNPNKKDINAGINIPVGGEEVGLNEIYHFDCMEFMSRMKYKCVNMTFTDIPYNSLNDVKSGGLRIFNKGAADEITFDLDEFLSEVKRVTLDIIIIFCGFTQFSQVYQSLDKRGNGTTRILVWKKTNPQPTGNQGVYQNSMEIAVCYKKSGSKMSGENKPAFYEDEDGCLLELTYDEAAKFFESNGDLLVYSPCGDSKLHATTKNPKMLKNILTDCASKNWLIFDPCCGSGNHLKVAKELGCRFVGCELNSKYYAIARKNIGLPPYCQSLYPKTLFGPRKDIFEFEEKINHIVDKMNGQLRAALKEKLYEKEKLNGIMNFWRDKTKACLRENIENMVISYAGSAKTLIAAWDVLQNNIREFFNGYIDMNKWDSWIKDPEDYLLKDIFVNIEAFVAWEAYKFEMREYFNGYGIDMEIWDSLIKDVEDYMRVNIFRYRVAPHSFEASVAWDISMAAIREKFMTVYDEAGNVPEEIAPILKERIKDEIKRFNIWSADPLREIYAEIDDAILQERLKLLAQALMEKMTARFNQEDEIEKKIDESNISEDNAKKIFKKKYEAIEKLKNEEEELRAQIPGWYFLINRHFFTRDYLVNKERQKGRPIPKLKNRED